MHWSFWFFGCSKETCISDEVFTNVNIGKIGEKKIQKPKIANFGRNSVNSGHSKPDSKVVMNREYNVL